MKKLVLFLIMIAGLGIASTLLTNGDFEKDLTDGWQIFQFSTADTIDRGTGYDPDPDYELYVLRNYGNGYCRVWQSVDIPTTDLAFSIKARLWAYDNDADTLCWAAAAVIVSYLDQAGSIIGETRIVNMTTPCPWINTPTLHLISANDTLWHTYAFNVNAELANLPGVNPSVVKKIRVAAYDTTAHTC
jgi:hypothetical protein